MAELRVTFKIDLSKPYFILQSFFDKKHSKLPGKYLRNRFFKVPQTLIFFPIPLKNLGLVIVPQERNEGLILCLFLLNIFDTPEAAYFRAHFDFTQ